MNDKELVDQLAFALGIETDMGKEFLRQMILNARLFERKQRDYGSKNYSEFGERGAIMRAYEKYARLKKLAFEPMPEGFDGPQNESIADSWDDLANIAVIGRLCHDGKWK